MKQRIQNNLTLYTVIATIQLPITVLIMYGIYSVFFDISNKMSGWDGLGPGLFGVALSFGIGCASLAIYIAILATIAQIGSIKKIIIPLSPIILCIIFVMVSFLKRDVKERNIRENYLQMLKSYLPNG